MLLTSNQLVHADVLSLHMGRPIARLGRPIIDPRQLQVVGFYCEVQGVTRQMVLLEQDIREVIPGKVLIDSVDEMAEPDDLLRLKGVLEINFELIGKIVITDQKRRIGTVKEYVVESNSFLIQKIYVKPPVLRTLLADNHVIDRQQIIEVTDQKVIVSDTGIRSGALAKAPVLNT